MTAPKFGYTTRVGQLVAGTAVATGHGAVNGRRLVRAQMPHPTAEDGLFVAWFAQRFRQGTPRSGIALSIVVAVVIPNLFWACAQLAYRAARGLKVNGWAGWAGWAVGRNLAIVSTSVLFSRRATLTAGYQTGYRGMLLADQHPDLGPFPRPARERHRDVTATIRAARRGHCDCCNQAELSQLP